ncbi:MAG: DUF1844 domain-containing protein [Verrucomicrobiota bacterium]|nr:DUF1844 domain-containing protein [Verrucomicrobiota bacterium]MDD8047291.1 DUF1844 domain-containing protein [Verrucomicrobiota bacterium]MDD8052272.1 DUF1844 domain-containing protein [Verrucomicrobiota bacterium]MDI9385849.1 DUF1844 domain-containing protein [Verrucomicrobiota bacterium]
MEVQSGSKRQKWLDSLFFSHLNELAMQSQLFLGKIPHPATGETIYDSDLARQSIDTLTAIVQRCEAGLQPQEKSQIDTMLDQLRLLYVETVGQPVSTPAQENPKPEAEKETTTPSPDPGLDMPPQGPDSDEDEDRKVRFQKSYG